MLGEIRFCTHRIRIIVFLTLNCNLQVSTGVDTTMIASRFPSFTMTSEPHSPILDLKPYTDAMAKLLCCFIENTLKCAYPLTSPYLDEPPMLPMRWL